MNKILIVEDEEAIANLIKFNLQHAGYSCEVANDGNAKEARRQRKKRPRKEKAENSA